MFIYVVQCSLTESRFWLQQSWHLRKLFRRRSTTSKLRKLKFNFIQTSKTTGSLGTQTNVQLVWNNSWKSIHHGRLNYWQWLRMTWLNQWKVFIDLCVVIMPNVYRNNFWNKFWLYWTLFVWFWTFTVTELICQNSKIKLSY